MVLLSKSENDLQSMEEALMNKSKQMGLAVNEENTKYMVLSRKINRHSNLILRYMEFDLVGNFKYLGVELNVMVNNHKKLQKK